MTSPFANTSIWDQPNTLFPHQPGYQRPDRADDYQPGDIPIRSSAQHAGEGTTFQQANAAMVHAQNEYQRHIKRTNADKDHYSQSGYQQQLAGFVDTAAFKAIDHAVDQVRARRDAAQKNLTEVRRALSPDGDTAAELRATRYWNRTKGILDTAKSGTVIHQAGELIAAAEPNELGVLIQELPAYLTVRDVPTNWIDAAIGQAAPEYGTATTTLHKAEQALIITEHNARRLQASIGRGDQIPIPLALPNPNKPREYDPDA